LFDTIVGAWKAFKGSEAIKAIATFGTDLGNGLKDGIVDGFENASQFVKTKVAEWGNYFKSMLPNFLTSSASKTGKGNKASYVYDSKLGKAVIPDGHATGGPIYGAGTGTSDSIPAMLSNGEYVINAAASRKLGLGFLNKINRGESPIFRASGGPAAFDPIPSAASVASNAGSRISGSASDLNTRLAQVNLEISRLTSATSDNTAEVSTLNESADDGTSGSVSGN